MEHDLQPLAKELNLRIIAKGGSIGETSVIVRIEVAEEGEDGVILNREAEDFKALAAVYDLSPDDLGRKFKDSTGKTFQIVGLKSRSSKYPILATSGGKRYKFPVETVKGYLERAAK